MKIRTAIPCGCRSRRGDVSGLEGFGGRAAVRGKVL